MKKNHKKEKKQKNIVFFIIAIVLVFLIIKYFSGNKYERNEITNIFIDNNNITSNINNEIKIKDDIIYMSINDIKQFIDKTIYIEDKTDTIIMTSDKKLASIKINEKIIKRICQLLLK